MRKKIHATIFFVIFIGAFYYVNNYLVKDSDYGKNAMIVLIAVILLSIINFQAYNFWYDRKRKKDEENDGYFK